MAETAIGSYQGYEDFLVEKRPDGVVIGTLNRPEVLNALGGGLRLSIRRFIHEVGQDPEARVLVFTGAGRGFCSGADLTTGGPGWPAAPTDSGFAWCVDLLSLNKPTIAAINGAAAGGGLGLTLLCDIRVCSDRARLIPIWLKRAIHPDDLVTWTLPRLAGYSRALKYLWLAEDIPLDEAERTGLIEKVVPADQLMEYTLNLASRLAKGPLLHMGLTKQAVLKQLQHDPWQAAMYESWSASRAASSPDGQEGRAAFRERREPAFKGTVSTVWG